MIRIVLPSIFYLFGVKKQYVDFRHFCEFSKSFLRRVTQRLKVLPRIIRGVLNYKRGQPSYAVPFIFALDYKTSHSLAYQLVPVRKNKNIKHFKSNIFSSYSKRSKNFCKSTSQASPKLYVVFQNTKKSAPSDTNADDVKTDASKPSTSSDGVPMTEKQKKTADILSNVKAETSKSTILLEKPKHVLL